MIYAGRDFKTLHEAGVKFCLLTEACIADGHNSSFVPANSGEETYTTSIAGDQILQDAITFEQVSHKSNSARAL